MDFVFTEILESNRGDGSLLVRFAYGDLECTVFYLKSGKISFPTALHIKHARFTEFYSQARAFVEAYNEMKDSKLNDTTK